MIAVIAQLRVTTYAPYTPITSVGLGEQGLVLIARTITFLFLVPPTYLPIILLYVGLKPNIIVSSSNKDIVRKY